MNHNADFIQRLVFWIIGGVVLVAFAALISVSYYLFKISPSPWELFQGLIIPTMIAIVGLLLAATIAIVGLLLARSQSRSTRRATEQRAQETALQAYLDQITQLLVYRRNNEELRREHPDEAVRELLKARTVSMLPALNEYRKWSLLSFLYVSRLIDKEHSLIDLTDADLSNADFSKAQLRGIVLTGAKLQHANLCDADLAGAKLERADLSGANLKGTTLKEADLSDAILRGARLQDADLSTAILVGVDLQGQNLSGVKLEGAVLRNADLSDANLSDARLQAANLFDAILEKAKLPQANLSGANLHDVTFKNANLAGANLEKACLLGVDLSGADLMSTVSLTQEQLEQAIGDKFTLVPASLKRPDNWIKKKDERESLYVLLQRLQRRVVSLWRRTIRRIA